MRAPLGRSDREAGPKRMSEVSEEPLRDNEDGPPAVESSRQLRPLEGLRVTLLRVADYSIDARARKQAAALTSAGAHVTMIGVGTYVAPDLAESGWDVRLLPSRLPPRLGREDVWWPLRVAVNLTYTKARQAWIARQTRTLVSVLEPSLVSAALESEPDVVHAYDIFTLPAAMRVKEATGARVVYDVLDLCGDVEYYDEVTRAKFKTAESRLIGDVDATIVVSEVFADIYEERYGIRRPEVIYHGPSEIVARAVTPQHPPRLFFQGAYQRNRNLDSLIRAMEQLGGRATLTLQGFGGVEDELRALVRNLRLDDVVSFVPPVAPLDVVKSASAYDIGVICYRADSLNLISTVPNKLMDYLGAGLALAVSDLPGPRSVLQGTGAAVFIDPSDSETIARDLGKVLEDGRIMDMKRASLELAKEFEWPTQARKLTEIYRRLPRQRIA